MEWLVYEWYEGGQSSAVETTEFDDLEEAKAYADRRANYMREQGLEYDVRIYQLTNY